MQYTAERPKTPRGSQILLLSSISLVNNPSLTAFLSLIDCFNIPFSRDSSFKTWKVLVQLCIVSSFPTSAPGAVVTQFQMCVPYRWTCSNTNSRHGNSWSIPMQPPTPLNTSTLPVHEYIYPYPLSKALNFVGQLWCRSCYVRLHDTKCKFLILTSFKCHIWTRRVHACYVEMDPYSPSTTILDHRRECWKDPSHLIRLRSNPSSS